MFAILKTDAPGEFLVGIIPVVELTKDLVRPLQAVLIEGKYYCNS